MNLALRLAEIGRLHPDHEAVRYHDQRLTYSRLLRQINQFANGLRKFGIGQGERVLIALGNCPEFIISYFALMQIKGVLVPVNPQYTLHEFSVIVKDAAPAAVITDPAVAPVFARIKEKTGLPKEIIVIRSPEPEPGFHSFAAILAGGEPVFNFTEHYGRDEVVELLYTPGSISATPKGAMLTNNNLYSNAVAFAGLCRLTPDDRSLLVAPVYHAAAQTCVMNASLMAGATLVVHDGWKGPEAVLRSIQEDQITFFYGPPTMYALLINYPERERYNTGSWRVAYTGAAPLSPEIFAEFEEKFGLQITEGYGLTETSPVVCSNPVEGLKKVGSVGPPIPGVEVKIVDYEDREVPVGQVGEIVVRGPNVMKGYYNRPEETSWVMRNGWFHTDDLAYMDSDGYVFIIDRKKDLIIRGGLNVHPREVEDVLYAHPKVFDVAVVGMPDPVWGEEVMAIVLLREGEKMDAEELREYCRDKLAKYKIPRYIHFVEEIPKTSSGKLLKYELKHLMENA
ncbi:MAG: long-chain fatty acid--CoA ligase [Armatimonadetes bacterium]|nr:long-chain fatty acid--CoA ligase [Armatimonadota bacterium]